MRGFVIVFALALLVGGTSADFGTCWGLETTECILHPDCEVCEFFHRKELCVWSKLAGYIPPKIGNCTVTPIAGKPQAKCDGFAEEGVCNSAPGCVWCLSAAVKPQCYPVEAAKFLPPGVFECEFPIEDTFLPRIRRGIV